MRYTGCLKLAKIAVMTTQIKVTAQEDRISSQSSHEVNDIASETPAHNCIIQPVDDRIARRCHELETLGAKHHDIPLPDQTFAPVAVG